MSAYLGDYKAGRSVDFKFTTISGAGLPTTLAGSPVISVYKKNDSTQSVAGVTLTVDFDSRSGLNHVTINLASDAAFYEAGNDYDVVITTGTVDSVSVVGYVVGSFSIENRTVNWAQVANQSSTVNLVNTSIGSTGSGSSSGSSSSLNESDIVVLAQTPKRVTTDEGTVEERPIDEVIKADQYGAALSVGDSPLHGLRISRCKPGGPV